MGDEEIERRDVEALLATRQELGQGYDAALVDSFADRIDRVVAERTSALEDRRDGEERHRREGATRQFVLGIISLGTGIPITAIAATQADVAGLVVAWLGIVGVNAAHAATVNGRRR